MKYCIRKRPEPPGAKIVNTHHYTINEYNDTLKSVTDWMEECGSTPAEVNFELDWGEGGMDITLKCYLEIEETDEAYAERHAEYLKDLKSYEEWEAANLDKIEEYNEWVKSGAQKELDEKIKALVEKKAELKKQLAEVNAELGMW